MSRRPSLALLLFALAVRLVFLLISHGVPFVESTGPYPALFQNETTNIASSIAGGYGYQSPFVGTLSGDPGFGPSSWIAPVYPYFCALSFKLFGAFSRPAFFFIVLVQCGLSALTVVPILRIGELTVGRRAGIVAAVVWAVFPWFSQWANTYIWEVSLSALLFASLFWFALRLERAASLKTWLAYGASWGFALLVNPALLTLLAASLIWLAFTRRRNKLRSFRPLLLALVTCTVLTSPWLIRNRVVFGQWTFIRTNFGFEFWMANYHFSPGRDWMGRSPTVNLRERAHYQKVGELAYVAEKGRLARQFIAAYPAEFLSLTGQRALMYWDGSTIKYNFPAAPYWLPWSFLPLSLLSLLSLLYICRRRVPGSALYAGAFLLYPLPYYITFNQARYRHALEPLMLLVISFAALELQRSLRHRFAQT